MGGRRGCGPVGQFREVWVQPSLLSPGVTLLQVWGCLDLHMPTCACPCTPYTFSTWPCSRASIHGDPLALSTKKCGDLGREWGSPT